jgi:hypothetical protein
MTSRADSHSSPLPRRRICSPGHLAARPPGGATRRNSLSLSADEPPGPRRTRGVPHRRSRVRNVDFEREVVLRGRAFETCRELSSSRHCGCQGGHGRAGHRGSSPHRMRPRRPASAEAPKAQSRADPPDPEGSGGAPISANGRETRRRLDLAALRTGCRIRLRPSLLAASPTGGAGTFAFRLPDEGPTSRCNPVAAFATIGLIGSRYIVFGPKRAVSS